MSDSAIPVCVDPVCVGSVSLANHLPLALIAGPCAIESRDHCLRIADAVATFAARAGLAVIFKSSFDKANRTAAGSPRGIGLDAGLEILAEVKAKTGLPVLTDIHTADQSGPVAQVVDCLQIPAFLCRQTDLLVASAATGRPVNVKKGQFLAPWDMCHVVEKLRGAGNGGVIVTERGVSFGYNTLVSDMRALPILAESTGAPVVFDATHSVQQPGGRAGSSGGEARFAPLLARSAAAAGVAAIFLECHDDPAHALSDGPNMIPLSDLPGLLAILKEIDATIKGL